MMIDPKAKLIDILAMRRNTLISRRTDRGERELYERIVALYLKIAQELETLINKWPYGQPHRAANPR
jgi:hypothetical protein